MKYDKHGILEAYKKIPLNSKILADDEYRITLRNLDSKWIKFADGWEECIGKIFKKEIHNINNREDYRRKIKF